MLGPVGPTCRKATAEEEDASFRLNDGARMSDPGRLSTSVAVVRRAGVFGRTWTSGRVPRISAHGRLARSAGGKRPRRTSSVNEVMGFMSPDGQRYNYGRFCALARTRRNGSGGAYIQFLRCPGTEIVSAAEAIDHRQIRRDHFPANPQVIESLMKVHIQTPAIIGKKTAGGLSGVSGRRAAAVAITQRRPASEL